MRFVTYLTVETEPRLGLLHDGLVVDVEYFGAAIGQNLPSTMLDFIDLGPIALRFLQEAVTNASTADFVGTSLPQANVALLAPIPRPRKNIFGIGLNYTEHVAESARSLDKIGRAHVELQSLMRISYAVLCLKKKKSKPHKQK